MPHFPPISVRQPKPYDIVDDPVGVCGLGTGFEGVLGVRVRDGHGTVLLEQSFTVGGTGILDNFELSLALPGIPSTPRGSVEVFESSAGDGSDINKVVVPVVFGRALLDPYHGFFQYKVVQGDTLSKIAQQFYGDASQVGRIFEANRDQLHDPNLIHVGQSLRIPQ
jgi:LysM repeat protein